MCTRPYADVDWLRGQPGDQEDGLSRQLEGATGRIRRARGGPSIFELVVSTTIAANAVQNDRSSLPDEESQAGTLRRLGRNI
jgi:hypothetical protein